MNSVWLQTINTALKQYIRSRNISVRRVNRVENVTNHNAIFPNAIVDNLRSNNEGGKTGPKEDYSPHVFYSFNVFDDVSVSFLFLRYKLPRTHTEEFESAWNE